MDLPVLLRLIQQRLPLQTSVGLPKRCKTCFRHLHKLPASDAVLLLTAANRKLVLLQCSKKGNLFEHAHFMRSFFSDNLAKHAFALQGTLLTKSSQFCKMTSDQSTNKRYLADNPQPREPVERLKDGGTYAGKQQPPSTLAGKDPKTVFNPLSEKADKFYEQVEEKATSEEEKKETMFQRFKSMAKKYWYVLVPVHLITSAAWFAAFYFAVISGLDVVALLSYLPLPDSVMSYLRNSKAGYVALAYALYKVATPLRYAVTVGATTFAVKFLAKRGLIKPLPSRKAMKEMRQSVQENVKHRIQKRRDEIKHK